MADKRPELTWQEHGRLTLTYLGDHPPTILLIHGYKFDSRVWSYLTPPLGVDAQVVSLGWSLPHTLRNPSWADVVAEIRAAADLLDDIDIIVAHGEGCAGAVDLALSKRPRALVLFDPAIDAHLPELTKSRPDLAALHDADLDIELEPEEYERFGPLLERAFNQPDDEWRIEPVAEALAAGIGQYMEDDDVEHLRPFLAGWYATAFQITDLRPAEPYWVERLRDVSVRVIVSGGWPGDRRARILAERAPQGEVVEMEVPIPLPWLANRSQAIDLVKRLLRG